MISNFFSTSGIITILVIGWLSVYLVATFWVFFYKFLYIKGVYNREVISLDMIMSGRIHNPRGVLAKGGAEVEIVSDGMLSVWKAHTLRTASVGIVFLSIVSSTAPFIGLFGTVTEILEAFSKMGDGQATFDVIAPVISKALVATAFGILSAIPAYSFYAILKRRLLELAICLQSQIDMTLSSHNARKSHIGNLLGGKADSDRPDSDVSVRNGS